MPIVSSETVIATKGFCDFHDLTGEVSEVVSRSELTNGSVTIFISGSTASVTTIEFEEGALADLRAAIERLAPSSIPYAHDRRWGDGNGFSHVRAALLGPSLVVPFNQRALLLGVWQQIVLIEFDNRPRRRRVIIQVHGEK